MTKLLRLVSLVALTASLGTGCIKTDCGDDDPTTTCYETPTRFEGQDEVATASISTGEGLLIRSDEGNVRVVTGGTAGEVSVVFTPYSYQASSGEAQAIEEMDSLTLSTDSTGGNVVIDVTLPANAPDLLGADIVVTIPSDFDGDVDIVTDDGSIDADFTGALPTSIRAVATGVNDIDIVGAAGVLDILGEDQVDVSIDVFEGGTISMEDTFSTLQVELPADANGVVQVSADGQLTVPGTWDGDGDSYTLGDGSGGTLSLISGKHLTVTER